jgi:hypothetical protein
VHFHNYVEKYRSFEVRHSQNTAWSVFVLPLRDLDTENCALWSDPD